MAVDRLEAGALPEGSSDPVVLLVKAASGDEEVGAAGANLKGVILRHSLPHLSHLGVSDQPARALKPAHAIISALRQRSQATFVVCLF